MTNKVKYERLKSHQEYLTMDGTRPPGVTTVLGVKAKPALINWAWKEGKAGRDLNKVKQQAFDVGSCFHFMAECHAKGVEPDLDCFCKDDIDKAENAFIKFLGFWEQEGLVTVATELQLASSTLGFGGTSDLIAMDKGAKTTVIDFKTSKAVYSEYKCQLAALEHLWNSGDITMINGVAVPRKAPVATIERRIILRVGKEDLGDFEAVEVSEAESHDRLEEFFACLRLHQWSESNKRKWK
jgi:hypothetical protein